MRFNRRKWKPLIGCNGLAQCHRVLWERELASHWTFVDNNVVWGHISTNIQWRGDFFHLQSATVYHWKFVNKNVQWYNDKLGQVDFKLIYWQASRTIAVYVYVKTRWHCANLLQPIKGFHFLRLYRIKWAICEYRCLYIVIYDKVVLCHPPPTTTPLVLLCNIIYIQSKSYVNVYITLK